MRMEIGINLWTAFKRSFILIKTNGKRVLHKIDYASAVLSKIQCNSQCDDSGKLDESYEGPNEK